MIIEMLSHARELWGANLGGLLNTIDVYVTLAFGGSVAWQVRRTIRLVTGRAAYVRQRVNRLLSFAGLVLVQRPPSAGGLRAAADLVWHRSQELPSEAQWLVHVADRLDEADGR